MKKIFPPLFYVHATLTVTGKLPFYLEGIPLTYRGLCYKDSHHGLCRVRCAGPLFPSTPKPRQLDRYEIFDPKNPPVPDYTACTTIHFIRPVRDSWLPFIAIGNRKPRQYFSTPGVTIFNVYAQWTMSDGTECRRRSCAVRTDDRKQRWLPLVGREFLPASAGKNYSIVGGPQLSDGLAGRLQHRVPAIPSTL